MMTKQIVEYASCGVGAVMTVVQTNQVFQLVSLILTCIATAVAIGFTIYKWYKAAKADGKIDEKELEELGDILKDGAEKVNNIIESQKGEESEKSEGEK